MAIPRLASRKIIGLSAAALLGLTACSTQKKPEKIAQVSQTTVGTKTELGASGTSSLEALAKYYEAAAEASSPTAGAANPEEPSGLPKRIGTGTPTTIGKILMVNEESRFVIIDTKSGFRPPAGATVRAQGIGGVSSLRVSKEQRREFLSADFVEGTPSPGDSVIWER